MSDVTYSNPRKEAVIGGWPLGGSKRGTAIFRVDVTPKGERVIRTTRDENGIPNAPKKLTFSPKQRIVDGNDGRTYLVCLSVYHHITVMRGDMQYQHEVVHKSARPERYDALLALFDE